jgi:hypothetical protein
MTPMMPMITEIDFLTLVEYEVWVGVSAQIKYVEVLP